VLSPSTVRIGFDVSQTGDRKAGCGYFADSLLRALTERDRTNQYVLYPTFGDGVWDAGWPRSVVRVQAPHVRMGLGHRDRAELERFWQHPDSDLEQQLGSPDVIQSNNFYCPTDIRRARVVYTLHDLSFMDHPDWSTEENRLTCFGGVFNASLFADHVVAVSRHTREHFLGLFPHYPAERVSVVYEASRYQGKGRLGRRPPDLPPLNPDAFWLAVGTLEPRKNYPRLLRAYARLCAAGASSRPLVVVGARGWLLDELDQTVAQLAASRQLLQLGYVSDAALQWLYENCFGFVYASLFEGFGLPVVEAMSRGAAVVASSATSLPEVVGDAGLLVDPLDESAILAGMQRLDADEQMRRRLKTRAAERAATFSWATAADQVLDIYARVLARPPAPAAVVLRQAQDERA